LQGHASQYQNFGLSFFPLYGISAISSWTVTGSTACANMFEMGASLKLGGYTGPGSECATAIPPLPIIGQLARRGMIPGGVL